jgi:hypothetical protein
VKQATGKKQIFLLAACSFFGLFLNPEFGGSTLLRSMGELLPNYMVLHPRTQYSSLFPRQVEWSQLTNMNPLLSNHAS